MIVRDIFEVWILLYIAIVVSIIAVNTRKK